MTDAERNGGPLRKRVQNRFYKIACTLRRSIFIFSCFNFIIMPAVFYEAVSLTTKTCFLYTGAEGEAGGDARTAGGHSLSV